MAATSAPASAPATLRVVSRSTVVTGTAEAPVHNPPGTPLDLEAKEAADLIARGIVTPADAPAAEPATGPGITSAAIGGATVTQG